MWIYNLKHKIIGVFYRHLIKPILFKIDAESVHNQATKLGELFENQNWFLSHLFCFKKISLNKKLLELEFGNPIGLAAGFDYDGHLAKVMKYVGFGFNTVGTVTAQSYKGNEFPRLARLPKSKSLLVNKGFKSEGAEAVAKRLDKKNLTGHLIGISVGSSNVPSIDTIDKAIEDYLITFNIFKDKPYVKYFELNVSCPNTKMTESFTNQNNFSKLVKAIQSLEIKQPIFIKMPNEISFNDSDILVSTALKNNIKGFIFSNLVKNRNNKIFDRIEIEKFKNLKGNFSGKPTAENSIKLIKHTREKFGKKVVLISCGGIFDGNDAIERFNAGADLIQLITGMIYEGPQVIEEINRGLFSNSKQHVT